MQLHIRHHIMSEVQDECNRGSSVPCRWYCAPTMWTSPWGHTSTPLPLTPTSWRQPSSRARPWACHLSRPSVSALLLLLIDGNTILACFYQAIVMEMGLLWKSLMTDWTILAALWNTRRSLLWIVLSVQTSHVAQYNSCKLSLICVTVAQNLPALYVRSKGQGATTSSPLWQLLPLQPAHECDTMLLTAAGYASGSGTGFSPPDQRQSGSQQADNPQVCHCLSYVRQHTDCQNKMLSAKTRC